MSPPRNLPALTSSGENEMAESTPPDSTSTLPGIFIAMCVVITAIALVQAARVGGENLEACAQCLIAAAIAAGSLARAVMS